MSSAEIAAEIAAGLTEASEAVGSGPLVGQIKRKGAATGPDYQPVYGAAVSHNFTVVLSKFNNRERENTAILATDTKILCSVGAVTPAVSDMMAVAGVEYKIYGVDPLNPGGDNLMFTLWARA